MLAPLLPESLWVCMVQQLANVADVTVEVNAGTAINAPVVLQQVSSMIVNNSIAVRAPRPASSALLHCGAHKC